MTEITNLQVHEPGFITLTLSPPSSAYQVRLDGWNRWRAVDEFSWYPPNLFIGSVDNPLSPGERTLQVTDDGGATFATAQFRVGPEPEEPQLDDYRLLYNPKKVSDWDDYLREKYAGSITDQPDGSIRFWVPPSTQSYGRVELQLHEPGHVLGADGTEGAYEWEFKIPGSVVLPSQGTGRFVHLNQTHPNNSGGYGGGLDVQQGTENLFARIEGGTRISSNDYSSELEVVVGKLTRDFWHKVRYEVKWTPNRDGYVNVTIDGQTVKTSGVPTMGEVGDIVLWRLGFYPASVPQPGLEMFVRNVKVLEKV